MVIDSRYRKSIDTAKVFIPSPRCEKPKNPILFLVCYQSYLQTIASKAKSAVS